MITVIFPDNSRREIEGDGITGETLLLNLGLNPYEIILSRNGCMITEDTRVFSGDEIRLIAIVHGG
ncbi:MAG: MoaD/ThiS family protein [Methanoregulaceae archaeon]